MKPLSKCEPNDVTMYKGKWFFVRGHKRIVRGKHIRNVCTLDSMDDARTFDIDTQTMVTPLPYGISKPIKT